MKYLEEQLLEIYQKECINSGMSYNQVREKYGIPRGTWDYYIRKKFQKKADKRQYKPNDTFFDIIDSEIKAYLLGFLYADGYLATDGRIGIRLQEGDIEILQLIQKYICPNNPIESSNNQNFKRQLQHSIRWRSAHMYTRLKELGFCIDKTHTDSIILQLIPDNLKLHFLRGYTDGDGCLQAYNLSNSSYRKIAISWSNGCCQLFNDIKDLLPNYSWHLYNKDTYFVLGCYCQKEAYDIIKKLYLDCNFFLTRKMKIAEQIFNFYNNDNTELTNQITKG